MAALSISVVVEAGITTWRGNHNKVSVAVDNLVGAPSDTGLTVVAFKVGTNAPAVNADRGPAAMLAGLLVDDCMCAKGAMR